MPAAVVGGVEMLGVACGIITFVTRSCVVTTDSRQHCPECYRVKTWGDHRRHLATQPIPHGTPACMKSCEVYHMQSDSPVWRKYSTHDSGCLSSVWATAHWTTRQSRMWHRWQAWSRICTVMDYMKLTLKFINWDASCLLYPLAVKDELRSNEWLNGLMLIAVEKNIVKDLDLHTFVDMFALKPRKLKL